MKTWQFILGATLLFLLCLFSSLASGAGDNPVYKQYDNINITEVCSNNGTACSINAVCNMTVISPSGIVLVPNGAMTNQGGSGYFTYWLENQYTIQAGTYREYMYCCDINPSGCESSTMDFNVTPPGAVENNTYTFLILGILSVVLLVLSFIFQNHVFSFLSGLSFATTGVYTMIYGFNNIVSMYTRAGAFILIGLGMIIIVVSGFEFMDEMYGGRGETESEED